MWSHDPHAEQLAIIFLADDVRFRGAPFTLGVDETTSGPPTSCCFLHLSQLPHLWVQLFALILHSYCAPTAARLNFPLPRNRSAGVIASNRPPNRPPARPPSRPPRVSGSAQYSPASPLPKFAQPVRRALLRHPRSFLARHRRPLRPSARSASGWQSQMRLSAPSILGSVAGIRRLSDPCASRNSTCTVAWYVMERLQTVSPSFRCRI